MPATPIHQRFVASGTQERAHAGATARPVPAGHGRLHADAFERASLADPSGDDPADGWRLRPSGSRVHVRPWPRDSPTVQGGPCDNILPPGFHVAGHDLLAPPRRRDRHAAGRARRR